LRIDPANIDHLPALRVGARLSEQLAEALAASIREGRLQPGERLPTEQALVARFGVSRTVVREAVSRLKSLDLVESRQGSGAFVRGEVGVPPLKLDFHPSATIAAVMQMVEVRRALETEAAGLAAARRTAADVKRLRVRIRALRKAVQAGGDGVEEDVAFHRAVAMAAGNPFLLATLEYLGHFLRDATRVTRANEATRADFVEQVCDEHVAIVEAIAAGDVAFARRAGAMHMLNASRRIGSANPQFWARHGGRLASRLLAELGVPSPLPHELSATPATGRTSS
jgi:GntR family transcriptional repressor for pyruvate dehydrogenase complex